jgi:hypothetical protein
MPIPRRSRLLALLLILSFILTSFSASQAAHAASGNFVSVSSNQFVYNGQPVKLKGVNYYPQLTPWTTMFDAWQGNAIDADMARLQGMGANVVRVLLPFGTDYGWTNDDGAVDPEHLADLKQLVQAAGNHNLKVNLTLFDFYDQHPVAGGIEEGRDLTYMTQLAKAFRNDDRIFAWDIHNEPDNYDTWISGNQATVVDWLERMAKAMHDLDGNHPVTIGFGNYANYWVKGPDGRSAADFVDFISLHSYDAGHIVTQIQDIKQKSGKPILLQETGWPTGPSCNVSNYNETTQEFLYRTMVAAAQSEDIGGLLAWTMWDYRLGQSHGGGIESRDDHFGLLHTDGSEKPAVADFRAYIAPPLPSATTSAVAYTTIPYDSAKSYSARVYGPPLYFPETNVYVWDAFKDYWNRFGGLSIFGYPLTMARREVLSDGNEYVVQYFERARFELHDDANRTPGYATLSKADKLRLLVKLTPLGNILTAGRHFASVPSPSAAELAADGSLTYFPQTGHTLGGLFHQFWLDNNGLTNFGYPISQLIQEVNPADGKLYYVQYFERQRMEWHQELAGTPYEVQLGQLDREWLTQRRCLSLSAGGWALYRRIALALLQVIPIRYGDGVKRMGAINLRPYGFVTICSAIWYYTSTNASWHGQKALDKAPAPTSIVAVNTSSARCRFTNQLPSTALWWAITCAALSGGTDPVLCPSATRVTS